MARASAFQAEGRGFESRLPLQNFNVEVEVFRYETSGSFEPVFRQDAGKSESTGRVRPRAVRSLGLLGSKLALGPLNEVPGVFLSF